MSDNDCVVCGREVTAKCEAVTYDVCDKWRHRLCGTGISRRDYRLIEKGLKKLNHVCPPCSEAPQELSDPNSTMPMDISEDMHSTMIDSSQVHGTFHLQVSIESVPMPPQSPTSPSPALSLPPPPTPPSPALSLPPPLTPPSPTALQLPQSWTFPPTPSPLGPSPPSPLSSGFDISRHGSADTTMYIEQSLDERPMSQTILEDAGEITYDVIKEGIIRKKPKLVTSDGHSYVIKVPGKKTTYWRCCVRRKGNHCGATVAQRDNVFIPGSAPHTHPGDLLVAKKPILARDAKQEAVRHIELRPTMFADEAMTSLFGSKDSRIPKTKSVIRKMHRAREGVLRKQPKNLDFEFDDEFLKEPFLVGDVHVTGERHMMFATQTQLDLLTKARKWYLDGTFKAVHLPFVQLWSIHAFIREGDNMKQVPLMYMLTTRRRKQDYVAILQKVLDILEEAPAVECFTMDFEIALWHALREVFPSSKLKGCAFHWSQAVQKHIGEFGLARTYRERQSLHSLIRKLLALPFLPAADIKRAFRKLKEQADDCNEQVQDLFTYVSDEWLESSKWSEDEWSVYRQTIRTNNDTEGWHRKLNTKAGRGKVKTYRLLEILLVESKLVNLEVTRLLEGTTSRRCRLSDEWLFDLWDQYDNHDIVCEELLGYVGKYYGQF